MVVGSDHQVTSVRSEHVTNAVVVQMALPCLRLSPPKTWFLEVNLALRMRPAYLWLRQRSGMVVRHRVFSRVSPEYFVLSRLASRDGVPFQCASGL